METRKVTIINSRTQSQNVITSSATTLGELKAELRRNGIEFGDSVFYEGHMRAELIDDSSTLPTQIPYKGQVVNDLVFLLTKPDKKTNSGAISRAELYKQIQRYNLQETCKAKYGRNYTTCSTDQLLQIVTDYENHISSNSSTNKEKCFSGTEKGTSSTNVVKALEILVTALDNYELISSSDVHAIYDALQENDKSKVNNQSEMSQEAIDEMFDFIN